jgi:hypothetical protein
VITVVTPVSPIKSHPDTAILEQTIGSVRTLFPTAEIFLTFDGVREEQKSRQADYDEFIRRTLWLADHVWGNVVPFLFDEHLHQTGMARHIIDKIPTTTLLYVEQDTPLVTDEPTDFEAIDDFIRDGHSNVVRLHHEGVIPAAHTHLMHGHDHGCFIQTSQWSQRPHVASTAYYRRILENHFSPGAKCFIEDKMHGVLEDANNIDGFQGWVQHRLHIYDPGLGNMKRSYHIDGRAGEAKYDDSQVF